jgi:hypothetical protein
MPAVVAGKRQRGLVDADLLARGTARDREQQTGIVLVG